LTRVEVFDEHLKHVFIGRNHIAFTGVYHWDLG
jgi:hypothetical protein